MGMNIMMVTSEAVPFAKTGGLADVTSALSRALSGHGHEVSIFMPLYSFIASDQFEEVKGTLDIPLGFETCRIRIFRTNLGDSRVKVLFLDHPLFSGRSGLYGDSGSHTYRDNHIRFALLCRGALEVSRKLDMVPDIFHLHDWQSALLPAYLREYAGTGPLSGVKTLFTIHNIGYQGIFSKQDLHALALEWDAFSRNEVAYSDSINFLKSALLHSDHITTVSPTYAVEIMSSRFGEGLESLLAERSQAVSGILNGVDYQEWNSRKDPFLPAPFDSTDRKGKALAKQKLQQLAELDTDPGVPLIGMVGRLADQKGFGELLDQEKGALRRILESGPVQIVILGTGASWIESRLLDLAAAYPSLKLFLTFSDKMAHLIEGGSDFFLMPSRYEPCGLNQIYSLRYGSIPIVRATGGLADTVIPYADGSTGATGFSFAESDPDQIVECTLKALDIWKNKPEIIAGMQKRGMEAHFSWDDSALRYEELYLRLSSR
jgi:starch synthase